MSRFEIRGRVEAGLFMNGLSTSVQKRAAATMRQFVATVLFLVLNFATGSALGDIYKGVLVTPGSDLTIPIVVDVKSAGGIVSGKIKTSSPLTLEGPIVAGERIGLTCNLKGKLSPEVNIIMAGSCLATSYEGKFMLMFPKRGRRPGTFKLTLVPPENEPETKPPANPYERKGPSVATITACLNENTMCMVACPHDDRTAEFLCTNSCSAKLESCKAKKKRY